MSNAIVNNIGPLLLDAEEKGKKEGRIEGIAKGKEEQKIQTVLNSFSRGLSFDLIADIAELSENEVKRIVRQEKVPC